MHSNLVVGMQRERANYQCALAQLQVPGRLCLGIQLRCNDQITYFWETAFRAFSGFVGVMYCARVGGRCYIEVPRCPFLGMNVCGSCTGRAMCLSAQAKQFCGACQALLEGLAL